MRKNHCTWTRQTRRLQITSSLRHVKVPGAEASGIEVSGFEALGIEELNIEAVGVEVPGIEMQGIEVLGVELWVKKMLRYECAVTIRKMFWDILQV